jgi:iron(III) transport system ATP-binding protein
MLNVEALRMSYSGPSGLTEAVKGVSFQVAAGEFFTLLGPSGCGKSTTLRCIAGLETPSSGTITTGSTVVYSSDGRINVPAYKRGLGMVFQSYAIWPHMSVYENVAFPLKYGIHKKPGAEVRRRVMETLELVQLDSLADRPAPFLSGGQQQRVALARALVLEPEVLLLDEPLSNLDAKLREDMRREIQTLVKRTGTTTLYVTHDQLEALTMSDRVALMKEGVIDQVGLPKDVYQAPRTPFAAHFLGRTNILEGTVSSTSGPDGYGRLDTAWGVLHCALPEDARPGAAVTIGFRPESVVVAGPEAEDRRNVLRGTVAERTFAGDTVHLEIDLGGRTIHGRGDPFVDYAEGESVSVRIPPRRCYYLGAAVSSADPAPPQRDAVEAAATT